MNDAHILALDLGCRGAAVGLFLLIAALLLRDRRHSAVARLSAALAGVAAASAICAAPIFPPVWQWWSLPLRALSWGGPAVFWLWARAAFDDDFAPKPGHAASWAAMVGLGLFVACGEATWPVLGAAVDRALSLIALGLALLAVAQTLATWRADLVAGRRRLRIVVLIGTLAYIAAAAAPTLSLAPMAASASIGSIARAFGLCLLGMFGALSLFQTVERNQAAGLGPAPDDVLGGASPTIPAGEGRRASIDPALLRRLERLMTVERAYRQDGLTSGALAGKLGLPEYRLRRLINEGLGHRNFNAFLNHYRIEDAKAALSDPTQRDVPVLTIAMDAGFQSIGPFNRAFKADTDQTPTEYRRAALAHELPNPLQEQGNLEIGRQD